LIDPYRPATSI